MYQKRTTFIRVNPVFHNWTEYILLQFLYTYKKECFLKRFFMIQGSQLHTFTQTFYMIQRNQFHFNDYVTASELYNRKTFNDVDYDFVYKPENLSVTLKVDLLFVQTFDPLYCCL